MPVRVRRGSPSPRSRWSGRRWGGRAGPGCRRSGSVAPMRMWWLSRPRLPNLLSRQPEPVVSTLVISGKTPARVASTAAVLAEWMAGEGAGVPLADVAHTVNHHRTRHKTFAAVCARDRAQAVAGLQALAAGHTAVGVVDAHQGTRGSGTVFVYSGQGSQWAGMGRQLLADEPAFAAAVAELEPVFVEQVGFSLRQVLDSGEPVAGIDRIQPVLVGMQLALTALWRSYGVEPDAVIGHSMGEVTAAVVAGALSPADGLQGDRHPVAADVAAGRTGRDGAAGTGGGGCREFDRRLPRSHRGRVRLTESDCDRRAARAGRCGDRGGRRPGPVGAAHRG